IWAGSGIVLSSGANKSGPYTPILYETRIFLGPTHPYSSALLIDLTKEIVDIRRAQCSEQTGSLNRRRGKVALAQLQFNDAFFHRIGGDQLVDEHRLVLPDAVRAVGRLILRRR